MVGVSDVLSPVYGHDDFAAEGQPVVDVISWDEEEVGVSDVLSPLYGYEAFAGRVREAIKDLGFIGSHLAVFRNQALAADRPPVVDVIGWDEEEVGVSDVLSPVYGYEAFAGRVREAIKDLGFIGSHLAVFRNQALAADRPVVDVIGWDEEEVGVSDILPPVSG